LIKEKRFGFEPEVTAKIARVPEVRIYEAIHLKKLQNGKIIR
jgi:hypothetical protein